MNKKIEKNLASLIGTLIIVFSIFLVFVVDVNDPTSYVSVEYTISEPAEKLDVLDSPILGQISKDVIERGELGLNVSLEME